MVKNPDPETGELIEVRMFSDEIRELNKGALDAELTAVLAELVTAVQALRKPGSVALRITVAPYDSESIVIDADKLMTVRGEIVAKIPEETRPKQLLYATAEGGLSRTPPNSRQLPFGADSGGE
jgi:hypothetical protein